MIHSSEGATMEYADVGDVSSDTGEECMRVHMHQLCLLTPLVCVFVYVGRLVCWDTLLMLLLLIRSIIVSV